MEFAIVEGKTVLCTCNNLGYALDIEAALKAAGRDVQIHSTQIAVQWPKDHVPFKKGG